MGMADRGRGMQSRFADGRRPQQAATVLLWALVLAILCWAFVCYAAYAAAVLGTPRGLNYSEGLIWQQALWMFGPHAYGDISHPPFLVFEYPPVFHVLLRGLIALGLPGLAAGRALSLAATLACAILAGTLAWLASDRPMRRLAALAAGLLPFTLLPVISWSPLLRVDMLGLAFTYGGLVLAALSWRRPALLAPAMLLLVIACYTKQTFISAPCAVLAIAALRDWRLALRAGLPALAAGLVTLGALSWLTQGGFVRHILLYNINRFSLADAAGHALQLLTAYPIFAALAAGGWYAGAVVLWHRARAAGWRVLLRQDSQACTLLLLLVYAVTCTPTLLLAGKSGAAINYFLEYLCLGCVWVGWLGGEAWQSPRKLALGVPILLAVQTCLVPGAIGSLRAAQLTAARAQQDRALLARLRQVPGPLLSDDMVLTLRAGRSVDLEPAILAQLAQEGVWPERTLLDMLSGHQFGAVITAADPGDPTFDARYLPATRAAMLAAYPHVETFGDYRLRLP